MGTNLTIETLSLFNEIDYGPDENYMSNEVMQLLFAYDLDNTLADHDWKNQNAYDLDLFMILHTDLEKIKNWGIFDVFFSDKHHLKWEEKLSCLP